MPTGDPPQPPTSAGWLGDLAGSFGSIRSAPSLPLNAQDGDVLVYRGGEWVAMSPRDAFRLDCSKAADGHPVNRELFEQIMTIEARSPESHAIPRPPEPPAPPKKYRTAWAAILSDDEE